AGGRDRGRLRLARGGVHDPRQPGLRRPCPRALVLLALLPRTRVRARRHRAPPGPRLVLRRRAAAAAAAATERLVPRRRRTPGREHLLRAAVPEASDAAGGHRPLTASRPAPSTRSTGGSAPRSCTMSAAS